MSQAPDRSQPATLIAFVNQKGGPGKTTLAMHVASELARAGAGVLVADADPQATATRWAAAAPEDRPFPAALAGLSHAGEKLHRELMKHLNPYDFIVVDCPPSAESNLTRSALLVAELAVVPVVPSPPDLWAGVAISQVLTDVSVVNDRLKARLVVNRYKARTRLAAHTPDLLAQYGIPVLRAQIGEREAFRHAAATGVTVADLPRAGQAAGEITALTEELLLVLNGASP
ncbi:MAG: AAA family ATPase [Acidobacteria bacterium]|nr:AAA family ATPase [Acidobacteriota bacterium]MCY3931624.1 AAA family ATPase [Acidobacteriota bacterium]